MEAQKFSIETKKESGRWSKEEHQKFMLGLMQYGKNWKKVEEVVETRSGSQVRSHAQKFFNKLQKSTTSGYKAKKQRKNGQVVSDLNEDQVSFNGTDMLKSFDDQNSLVTPLEIISLIKKESIGNSKFSNKLEKVNLSNFKKSLEENCEKQNFKFKDQQNKDIFEQPGRDNHTSGSNDSQNLMAFKLNSFKSMNNILSAYESLNEADPVDHLEDESFLIGLTKKYKKYFIKGGHFENLIDFGNPHQVAKAAQIEKSIRKKSWTLAEGIEGNEEDLEEIKNKLKESKCSLVEKQQSKDQIQRKTVLENSESQPNRNKIQKKQGSSLLEEANKNCFSQKPQ